MDRRIKDRPVQELTQKHYNEFPFDYLTSEDERQIERVQSPAFTRFANAHLKPGIEVAEIGCGGGRSTLFMVRRQVHVLAVDLSAEALRIIERRAPAARRLLANNLELPLPDGAFDAVVSDGVIHHTADARQAFRENARILRVGGVMYVGVYRRYRYYYYLYNYMGRPVRWLEKRAWGRALVLSTLLPAYYLAHLAKSRGRRTWRGAKNLFYDYIITPRASFHTREEIARWGAAEGLELIDYDCHMGNVHAFVFRKWPGE